ncbi:MAG: SseB family protein [Candidatus Hinthialibacter antarcticus]|nr:SseB family protein [Candidatus Hinthialibacter antarcticus]
MNMSLSELPDTLFVLAALQGDPEAEPEEVELGEDDEISLVSLTDAEDVGFVPVWSNEEILAKWLVDFGVKMMSVEIERDVLLGILEDGDCEYLVLDMASGQEEFPIEQVFELDQTDNEDDSDAPDEPDDKQ